MSHSSGAVDLLNSLCQADWQEISNMFAEVFLSVQNKLQTERVYWLWHQIPVTSFHNDVFRLCSFFQTERTSEVEMVRAQQTRPC